MMMVRMVMRKRMMIIIIFLRAYAKTVAFSVRTNVMYDGTLDDDSPVHGSAVRLAFLFVMKNKSINVSLYHIIYPYLF